MQSKTNYISQTDFDRIIKAIPELGIRKWIDKDVEMLFKILYWCGLRPIEGIKIKKEDINLEDREINLHRTKTNKKDYAPIPSVFVAELSLYLRTKPQGRLLPGLTYPPFYLWLKRLGSLLDIEAFTTLQNESGEKTKGHIFRKSLGKDMLTGTHGKKFDIPIISKQLRHANVSTTMNSYLKANIEAVKEAW